MDRFWDQQGAQKRPFGAIFPPAGSKNGVPRTPGDVPAPTSREKAFPPLQGAHISSRWADLASDFSSLSTSALSGIDARPDTIEFLSSSRFLTAEQTVSFSQLERVNSAFTGTNHINYGKPQVAEFRQRYLNKYYTNPVREERLGDAYIGYDIVVSFGRLLHRYGKYFQVGLKRQDKIPGELTDFLEYKLSNDNRYIPYMKVRGAKVEIIEEKK